MSARRPSTQTTTATPQVSATHAANMPPDSGWLRPDSTRPNRLPSASMKLITWLLALWVSTSKMTAGEGHQQEQGGHKDVGDDREDQPADDQPAQRDVVAQR